VLGGPTHQDFVFTVPMAIVWAWETLQASRRPVSNLSIKSLLWSTEGQPNLTLEEIGSVTDVTSDDVQVFDIARESAIRPSERVLDAVTTVRDRSLLRRLGATCASTLGAIGPNASCGVLLWRLIADVIPISARCERSMGGGEMGGYSQGGRATHRPMSRSSHQNTPPPSGS
jgi:hypothetical protein